MKIALAGYKGFIGKSLRKHREDVEFVTLSRDLLYGDKSGLADTISHCDGIINLAGAPIAKRWTKKYKRIIEQSRKQVSQNLVDAVNSLEKKPEFYFSASAIGLYADQGEHTESEFEIADHYLASVVKQWEDPLQSMDQSVRQVILRIGLVLGKEGGAMSPLLQMARWGLLAVLASGRQFYSFIHLDDLLGAMDFIMNKKLSGTFNLCSPFPVDNATFTKILAEHTGTKLIVRIPSFFLKARLGEAHILISGGPKVLPARLIDEGYMFNYPSADEALGKLVKDIEESH
jgi:uncharacterized protein (TIGR01777 family)